MKNRRRDLSGSDPLPLMAPGNIGNDPISSGDAYISDEGQTSQLSKIRGNSSSGNFTGALRRKGFVARISPEDFLGRFVITHRMHGGCANSLASRMRSETLRRCFMALALYLPCFQALWFPLGAPLSSTLPCMRHPFRPVILGDRHDVPRRVLARHRGAWAICVARASSSDFSEPHSCSDTCPTTAWGCL